MAADLEQTQKLIEAARGGSREAYEALFALHRPGLERELARQLRGRRPRGLDASDVVQDALVDAVRGFRDFEQRGGGSFRRWLARILENRLRMTLRGARAARRERGPERSLSGSRTGGSAVAGGRAPPSPSTIAARGEELERLERALERLPAELCTVIRMVRVEGLTLRAVAQRLGRSENAVQKLLARAARELERDLERRGTHTKKERAP